MSESASLLKVASRHMTPNYAPPPFVLERGQGTLVWDTDEKRYLDFAGGIGVLALGHAHPSVLAAVTEQVQRLSHTSNLFYHRKYIEMCQRLAELSFGDKVFLTNSGTEAVEGALKIARRYFFARSEQRTRFVATQNAFHGRTYGSLSVTGQPTLQQGFGPLLADVSHVPYGDLPALEAAMDENTAAVILEPVQGNGGIRVASAQYLRGIRDLCDRTGALLIFDEVQTGIGRTARWFAYQHDNVIPDIMTLAKMLGGGLPLGAIVTREEIAGALVPGSHASTYGGNPVACAAGLATLDVITEEKLLENAEQRGAELRESLEEIAVGHSHALEVRGRGLMIGLALGCPAKPLQRGCIDRGLLCTVAGGSVLRLLPPLNVSSTEIQAAVSIIERSLHEVDLNVA